MTILKSIGSWIGTVLLAILALIIVVNITINFIRGAVDGVAWLGGSLYAAVLGIGHLFGA